MWTDIRLKNISNGFNDIITFFRNMKLNENLIDQFEEEAKRIAENEDREKAELITNHNEILKQKTTTEGLYDSDEEEYDEKTVTLDKEHVVCDNSSFITDKYMEDTNANTVANKLSDMILSFEQSPEEEGIFNPDPEQAFYVEDEIYISGDEFENGDEEFQEDLVISEDDASKWNQLKDIKKETRQAVYLLKTNTAKLCKCEVERNISFILSCKFQLEKVT